MNISERLFIGLFLVVNYLMKWNLNYRVVKLVLDLVVCLRIFLDCVIKDLEILRLFFDFLVGEYV